MQSLFRSPVQCAQLLLITLLVSAQFLSAQDVQMVPDQQDKASAEKAQTHKDDQKDDQDDQPVTTFKANANVVQLFFNVKDKKGGLIPNLSKDSFNVFEDHKPQTIK